jgi:hypothetical protein
MLRVFNFKMDDLEKAEYYINATETEYDIVSISITPLTNEFGDVEYNVILVGREKTMDYTQNQKAVNASPENTIPFPQGHDHDGGKDTQQVPGESVQVQGDAMPDSDALLGKYPTVPDGVNLEFIDSRWSARGHTDTDTE